MRPVAAKFPTSQGFGSGATQGVDPYGKDPMAALVRQYGNYQPFGHAGEDIACPVGTSVYAMASGTVLWADWGTNLPGDESEWGYRQRWYLYKGFPGIVTVIQHPGWIGVYAHLSNNDAAPAGTKVREGQLIALSGNTGGVAPHLHREALVDLNYTTSGDMIYGRVNPTRYDGTGGAAIAPQSTPSTPAKDWFDMATEAQLRKIVREEGVGYRNPALEKDDLYAIIRATRTLAVTSKAELAAIKSIVSQLAKNQGVTIDYDKVNQIVKDALASGVDVDVTVNGKNPV